MRGTVRKWGNSAAVRIPASVLNASGLRLDAPVDVREHEGCIVITPVQANEDCLTGLLAQITPDNVHAAIDFGRAVGSESF